MFKGSVSRSYGRQLQGTPLASAGIPQGLWNLSISSMVRSPQNLWLVHFQKAQSLGSSPVDLRIFGAQKIGPDHPGWFCSRQRLLKRWLLGFFQLPFGRSRGVHWWIIRRFDGYSRMEPRGIMGISAFFWGALCSEWWIYVICRQWDRVATWDNPRNNRLHVIMLMHWCQPFKPSALFVPASNQLH